MTSYQQPKRLVIKPLKPKISNDISGSVTEYSIGGFICKIIDNDGVTVLHEFWERYEKLAIQHCRHWLEAHTSSKKEPDA
jgi:hypothetical protein